MLTISISLVAVFIPLLLMGGIVGRLFREFAVTLSVAIVVSMVVSLTTTPMMCAHLLQAAAAHMAGCTARRERGFDWVVNLYGRTLTRRAAAFRSITLLVLLATIGLNVYLFVRVPKGFFPAAGHRTAERLDSGRPGHVVSARWTRCCCSIVNIVEADPAVDTVNGFTGGGGGGATNTGPHVHFAEAARGAQGHRGPDHRAAAAEARAGSPAPRSTCRPSQDLRVGGRQSNAQYQFTMRGDNLQDLTDYAPTHARGAEDHPDHRRRQQRSAEPRPASPWWTTTATPRRASASRRS